MVVLITIDQANDHLRLDLEGDGASPEDFSQDARTAEVERKMEEATDMRRRLHQTADHGWTIETVPPLVRAAILLVLAWLWEHRGDDETDVVQADGYLTRPVTSLLHRYRDPAMA